jgi:hypothetical protein
MLPAFFYQPYLDRREELTNPIQHVGVLDEVVSVEVQQLWNQQLAFPIQPHSSTSIISQCHVYLFVNFSRSVNTHLRDNFQPKFSNFVVASRLTKPDSTTKL